MGCVLLSLVIVIGSAALDAGAADDRSSSKIEFNRDIRPLLSDRCFHATVPMQPSARRACGSIRRARPRPTATAAGDRAGRPRARASCVQRITADDDDEQRMPPVKSGKSLERRRDRR